MKVVAPLCEMPPTRKLSERLDSYADGSIYDTMIALEPEFNETFILCKLFDKWIDCSKIMDRTLTEKGFCHSFNTISLQEFFTDQYELIKITQHIIQFAA